VFIKYGILQELRNLISQSPLAAIKTSSSVQNDMKSVQAFRPVQAFCNLAKKETFRKKKRKLFDVYKRFAKKV